MFILCMEVIIDSNNVLYQIKSDNKTEKQKQRKKNVSNQSQPTSTHKHYSLIII